LKHLFLAEPVEAGGEKRFLRADGRILSLLRAGRISEAVNIAVTRLRVAGLNPLQVQYDAELDPMRLAASLLIPVWAGRKLAAPILHSHEPKEG
jgi:CRISPR-associated protein Csx17